MSKIVACYYIDVFGLDKEGNETWQSGNVMRPKEYNYGGFYYTYHEAKYIFNHFEDIAVFDNGFKPLKVFIGHSPAGDGDNTLFESREVK